jgi:hypothetical protein
MVNFLMLGGSFEANCGHNGAGNYSLSLPDWSMQNVDS